MALEHYMFDEAFDFGDDSYQQKNFPQNPPQIERWPPLGAASSDDNASVSREDENRDETKHIEELEKEQEQLNFSLMALTSHFAQVQFRLKQIVSAPKAEQDKLLQELEEFAFIGCPEALGPNECKTKCISCTASLAYECYDKRLADERERQRNLADQLRMLLDELEKCAKKQKETQTNVLNDNIKNSKSDKKGFIVEQLRTKLNMTNDEFESLSPEDVKNQIDKAMAKLVNPGKAKEQLINQLSTQIKDMEHFVEFLKDNEDLTNHLHLEANETDRLITEKKSNSRQKLKKVNEASKNTAIPNPSVKQNSESQIPAPHTKILKLSAEKRKRIHEASIAVMKKALTVLQIFAISQFGCSAKHFEEHMMRKAAATAASTGYQNALTNLKDSTDRIIKIHEQMTELDILYPDSESDSCPGSPVHRKTWSFGRQQSVASVSRSRSSSVISVISALSDESDVKDDSLQQDLIREVRNELAPALRDLLQHGLCRTVENSVLSTKSLLGCISARNRLGDSMHAWEYFNEFYKMKHGNRFNNQPNVKLSESFGVDLGGTQETPKQSLLTAMHKIKTSHEPRKRSYDAMFRALVCAGLNHQKLLYWVRVAIRCPELVDKHYERWSFLVRTGFDEVLAALEKLSALNFYLPEDLAIRHLLHNYNEFGDPY